MKDDACRAEGERLTLVGQETLADPGWAGFTSAHCPTRITPPDKYQCVLGEAFAAALDEAADRDEQQIARAEGGRAPADHEQRDEIRSMQDTQGEEGQQRRRRERTDERQHPEETRSLVRVAAVADAVQVHRLREERRQCRRGRCDQHVGRDDGEHESEPQRPAAAGKHQSGQHQAEHCWNRRGEAVADRLAPEQLAHGERQEHLPRKPRLVDRELIHRERNQAEDRRERAEGRQAETIVRTNAGDRHPPAAGRPVPPARAASAAARRLRRGPRGVRSASAELRERDGGCAGLRPGITRFHSPPNDPGAPRAERDGHVEYARDRRRSRRPARPARTARRDASGSDRVQRRSVYRQPCAWRYISDGMYGSDRTANSLHPASAAARPVPRASVSARTSLPVCRNICGAIATIGMIRTSASITMSPRRRSRSSRCTSDETSEVSPITKSRNSDAGQQRDQRRDELQADREPDRDAQHHRDDEHDPRIGDRARHLADVKAEAWNRQQQQADDAAAVARRQARSGRSRVSASASSRK